MNPYFENKNLYVEYKFIYDFLSKNHKKTHDLVYKNIKGVYASDIDYVNPIKNEKKIIGLLPNPINADKIKFIDLKIDGTIKIFLGINSSTYNTKGIVFFEKALEVVSKKYEDKIEIIIAQNLPYQEYIKLYDSSHIVLDQVYAFDQGYNALEAMAKGKVVFTGAEKEFENYYNLQDEVAINALPDVDYLVTTLSYLIENPTKITEIGIRSRKFIEKEHDYRFIAEKYLKTWG
ncbi:hypothetical protein FAQ01_26910 [Flavobacterium aquatile]|nr:hypothetical protein FAQ01_26910 [Flavobacterium aquatile]